MLSPPSTDNDEPLELLDLPSEILSQIATFLPQRDLIHFLSTSTALHTLTDTHLTPLRAVIKGVVRKGPPYPPQFEVLPSLRYFVGDDDGRLFLDVLVRAPARWLLERFEFGRWTDEIWKEAFDRRFLPSWKRYKNPEDKWRGAFLRTLGRLDHRSAGCAHHESWTRFIHLRRNGSASLNRIYTRTFDPYEIIDELKHQGGVAEYPTVVRVLCHLQDVRILAVGVLADKPSYYVNPNAHFVVHPPLLRPVTEKTKPRKMPHRNSAPPPGTGPSGIPAPPPRANSISFAVPVVAAPGLSMATATQSERSSLFAGFSWRPGRRHSVDNGLASSTENAEAGPSTPPLTRSWSRESDRRRSWAPGWGRRSSTTSLPLETRPLSPLVPILNTSNTSGTYSHTQYPNYTPFEEDPDETTLEALRRVRDFRADYREVEEDAEDRVWSGNEGIWGPDSEAMAETSVEDRRSRWVGPMIIIAQIFPGSRKEAYPLGAPQDSEVEDHGARRAGMGFERATEE
ncbi:hypothetical protein CcaverHIS002_0201070 [Cutaneotrichosporon cavernicola]|nr:hypothetical protein CcaverHIS002_0201070 [Cutaneotrichosporon cavernicola]